MLPFIYGVEEWRKSAVHVLTITSDSSSSELEQELKRECVVYKRHSSITNQTQSFQNPAL